MRNRNRYQTMSRYHHEVLTKAWELYRHDDLEGLAHLNKTLGRVGFDDDVKEDVEEMMSDISIANAEKSHP
jgi:hypothetical protein